VRPLADNTVPANQSGEPEKSLTHQDILAFRKDYIGHLAKKNDSFAGGAFEEGLKKEYYADFLDSFKKLIGKWLK